MFRVVHGERGRWSDVEHLLAWIVDLLNLLVWFKTKDGQKGSNRPKRVIRPGDDDAPTRLDDSDITESGAYRSSRNGPAVIGAAMTIEELDRFLKG